MIQVPSIETILKYNSAFNQSFERENNRNKLFGFSLSQRCTKFLNYVSDFHKLFLRMDNCIYGSMFNATTDNILVIGFRPNIGFNTSVVLNSEFNSLADNLRDYAKQDEYKRNIKIQREEQKTRDQNKRDYEQKIIHDAKFCIELSNKYQCLKTWCNDANEELYTNLNPENSVKQAIKSKRIIKKIKPKMIDHQLDDFLNEMIEENISILNKLQKISAQEEEDKLKTSNDNFKNSSCVFNVFHLKEINKKLINELNKTDLSLNKSQKFKTLLTALKLDVSLFGENLIEDIIKKMLNHLMSIDFFS
jgi:hypothetical protein